MFEESKIKECFFVDNISEAVSQLTESENRRFTPDDAMELLERLVEANSKDDMEELSMLEKIGLLVKQGFLTGYAAAAELLFTFFNESVTELLNSEREGTTHGNGSN